MNLSNLTRAAIAALLAVGGCASSSKPDASLTDPTHPANPNAPAAGRPSWTATPTPTSLPAVPDGGMSHDMGGMSGMRHDESQPSIIDVRPMQGEPRMGHGGLPPTTRPVPGATR